MMMEFAVRLRACRKEKRLTQEDLAKACGVPYSTYRRYESGGNDPSLSIAAALAEELGVSLDYLAGRSDSTTPSSPPRPRPPSRAEQVLEQIRRLLDEA